MGSKLLFRFRSGTHGLNGELGRHSTRNSSKACVSMSLYNMLRIVVFVRNSLTILMGFYRTTFI